MPWFLPPVVNRAYLTPVWCGFLSLVLVVILGTQQVWAQTTIYRWTDANGVVHYSNSTMSYEEADKATTLVIPKRPERRPQSVAATTAREPGKIPLVLLNNDASQKFVRATLEGPYRSKEVLMLVDTGAQRTLLDEKLARELDIEHIQDALLSGVNGTAKGWIGRLNSLKFGSEEVDDLYVMVAPVSGRLLLGMDVLERLSLAVSPRSLDRVQ